MSKINYWLYLLFISVLILGLVELSLHFLLKFPDFVPDSRLKITESYYNEYERSVIQYEPEMAVYDSTLFYKLKPGEFNFYNSEFNTNFKVNSMGLRDDEESIKKPKVIMLGDSYGMGWGVEQNETYANLIEDSIGFRILNAGISSYGTAREIKLLESLDVSDLETLIIQYCDNDYGEIAQYIMHNNQLVVSNNQIYDSIANLSRSKKDYYLFKRTLKFLPMLIKGELPELKIKDDKKYKPLPKLNAYKGFIDILKDAQNLPKHVKIIVFSLGVNGYKNQFLENVKGTLDKEFGSNLHDRITFLDFSNSFTADDYFVLDAHINAKGHQLVAKELIKELTKPKKGAYHKEWFYENGNLSIKANYYDCYKEGITTYYWPNGNKSMETSFKKGEKHGIEIAYSENGKEIFRKEYIMGVEQ